MSVFSQFGTSHEVINYSPNDYNAHNQNWQSVQDDRGVMYFANGDGILEYDGTFWKYIPSATITNVISIAINSEGKIFYGGIGEMGYLEADENGDYVAVEILPELHQEEFASEFFWNIHIFEEKAIFRSEKYFVSVIGEDVEVIEPTNGKTKRSFSTETEIWLQDDSRNIYWFEHENPDNFHFLEDSLLNSFILQGVYDLGRYQKMFITLGSGLYLHDERKGTTTQIPTSIEDFSKIHISSSLYLPNGELVLCTSNSGVIVLGRLGDLNYHYYEGNGLNTNSIRSAFLDREDILWLTSDEGISKVLYNIPYTVLQEEGSELKGISNSIIKHNGKVYVATSEGVFVMNESNPLDITAGAATKIKNLNWQCFDLASVGDDLFCATPGGLFLISDDIATPISTVYSRALCVPEGRIDQLLVGGRDKFIFYQKNQKNWIATDTLLDFPDEVLHIEQDKSVKGRLVFWAGLYNVGVVKVECSNQLDSIQYKQLGPKNGIEDGYILPFQINNKMYFSPKPGGIYNYNESSELFEYDDLITPLLGKDVSSWFLKEDYYQNIFFENSGPVHVLRKKNKKIEVDSLSLSTLNLGYINDIHIDDGGICWLAGEAGIARFNSTLRKQFEFEYHVLFKNINVNRDSALFSGNFFHNNKAVINQQGDPHQLTFDLNSISFEFSSPYFNGSDKIEYSYLLEGYDPQYSNWTKENKAVYTNLNEGKYTFKVKAKNVYGLESVVSTYNFSILPPWYRTLSAYVLYVIITILIIGLIVYLISGRLRRANERLQKIVKVKTSEIVAQRDVLAHQKEELEERNQEIIDSIAYAKRLQDAILPSQEEIDTGLNKSFIYYQPKDIVAGDFYWLEHVDDLALFAAADCTGHGVPGALVSVVCSNALNRAVNEFSITEPGKILDKVTELVTETFARSTTESAYFGQEVKDGMDIALCKIERNGNNISLAYSGANNPLWIISKREKLGNENVRTFSINGSFLHEIKANKQPVGWYDKRVLFNTHTVDLQKGDTVYLFSDGFADQFGGPRGKKYKYRQFKELLTSIHEIPMKEQLKKLNSEFDTWKGEHEQIDDVCVIGVRI